MKNTRKGNFKMYLIILDHSASTVTKKQAIRMLKEKTITRDMLILLQNSRYKYGCR